MAKETEEQETSQEPVETETPPETPAEAPAEAPKEEVETPDPATELQDKNRQLFERAKKAEAEAKELKAQLKDKQEQPIPSDTAWDTPETSTTEVKELTTRLDKLQEEKELDVAYEKYPVLKDKLEEFDTFREEHPRMGVSNQAKLFMVDNDLLNPQPARPGLERGGGGTKVPPTSGKLTSADVERLRTTDYEKYRKMLIEGKLDNISDE